MAATGLAHAYVAFLSSVLGWSIGEVLVSGLEPTLVAGLAPPARRGRYMGAYGASLSTGLLVAPLAGGLYSISPSLVWVGCAGLGWVAAAIQLFGGRRLGINGPRPSSTQEADVGVTGDHASTPDGGTELAAQT
jgi:MFS family permease